MGKRPSGPTITPPRSAPPVEPSPVSPPRSGYRAAIAEPHSRMSLVSRVVEAIERSRWSPALVYGGLALLLLAIEGGLLLADGTWPDDVRLIHLMLPVYAMVLLPSIHYRDGFALRALEDSRPLLMLDEAGYADMRYRLGHLPARRTFLAGSAGLALLALLLQVRPDGTDERLGLMTSPGASAVQWTLQVMIWSGVGITTYHIVRQMLIINEAYTRHMRINLFTPGPLYAFSRATAANSLFTVGVVVVASVALGRGGDPLSSLATTGQWIVVGGFALVLAGATFVAPLYGAHRLLAAEKTAALDAIGAGTETVVRRLHDRVDAGDLSDAEGLNAALDALTTSRATVTRISTWPWEADTGRAVVTGLVAQVVIYLVTQALNAWL